MFIKFYLAVLESSIDFITFFYQSFAKLLNYPVNPGMPLSKPDDVIPYIGSNSTLYPKLVRSNFTSPIPRNWLETIFGRVSDIKTITKYFYQSYEDGYYNFYIDTYRNTYFLPDSVSQFIQLNFNIHLDTTILEGMQQSIFIVFIFYFQLISFRMVLYWFIVINPFVRPWIYLTSIIDWTYDLTAGLVPGVWGIDLGFVLFMTALGKVTDCVNFLVFTMPFLPSEGQIGTLDTNFSGIYKSFEDFEFLNLLEDQTTKEVVFFKHLPKLWYQYPIPNELREYWLNERPDILKYMINHYQYLGINFYPDGYDAIINPLERLSSNSISDTTIYIDKISSFIFINVLPQINYHLL